ncbi:MAG: hypothetical protein U5J83_12815 [Bryobacterales bacterium]|nr:hypothetical protein [Bryobacterales bacterium]
MAMGCCFVFRSSYNSDFWRLAAYFAFRGADLRILAAGVIRS